MVNNTSAKLPDADENRHLALGYADSYMRSLSNRGFCAFDGILAPIVGRISMDLIAIDVTELPEERTRSGAIATIIGHPVTLDSPASSAGTIAYEILTLLGSRYRRIYRTVTGESNAGPVGTRRPIPPEIRK